MNTIITIGRQFGSGGREIGEKLAKHYGIKYYDKELLTRTAKESGFCVLVWFGFGFWVFVFCLFLLKYECIKCASNT